MDPGVGLPDNAGTVIGKGFDSEIAHLVATRSDEEDIARGFCIAQVAHEFEPAHDAAAAF